MRWMRRDAYKCTAMGKAAQTHRQPAAVRVRFHWLASGWDWTEVVVAGVFFDDSRGLFAPCNTAEVVELPLVLLLLLLLLVIFGKLSCDSRGSLRCEYARSARFAHSSSWHAAAPYASLTSPDLLFAYRGVS